MNWNNSKNKKYKPVEIGLYRGQNLLFICEIEFHKHQLSLKNQKPFRKKCSNSRSSRIN